MTRLSKKLTGMILVAGMVYGALTSTSAKASAYCNALQANCAAGDQMACELYVVEHCNNGGSSDDGSNGGGSTGGSSNGGGTARETNPSRFP